MAFRFEADIESLMDSYIAINQEKIAGNGEDSYLYWVMPEAVIAGVFDGCGGSGARKYNTLSGKTGAYISSRAAASAAGEWFKSSANNPQAGFSVESLKKKIQEGLEICDKIGNQQTGIRGSLAKDFPTTAAIIVCQKNPTGITIHCIWCGDSRCYLLDKNGLKQLTIDDIDDGLDAMDNLSSDGVLTNFISSSQDFLLHFKTYNVTEPCIVFTATDGCFGYFSTPMEFEYHLLNCLVHSDCVQNWELQIKKILDVVSGDDYSLCGYIFGYGSYNALRNDLSARRNDVYANYVCGTEGLLREQKKMLWNQYKISYYSLCNSSSMP